MWRSETVWLFVHSFIQYIHLKLTIMFTCVILVVFESCPSVYILVFFFFLPYFFQALEADAPCLDWGNFGMQVLNKKNKIFYHCLLFISHFTIHDNVSICYWDKILNLLYATVMKTPVDRAVGEGVLCDVTATSLILASVCSDVI